MESESFSVSTETRRHTLNRYAAYLGFLFLGAMCVTIPEWTQWLDDRSSGNRPTHKDDPFMVLLCLGLGLVVFLFIPISFFFYRGEWMFDPKGIRWKPMGRKE